MRNSQENSTNPCVKEQMTVETCRYNPILGCDCGFHKGSREMKILFLDIDGVLNNDCTNERCGRFLGIDRGLSDMLVYFLNNNTDIKVVLSSTWRLHPEMHQHIKEAGVEWIDVTPDGRGCVRGNEIIWWLDKHPEVTKFAILDDLEPEDFQPSHRDFLVQTDERTGLSFYNITQLQKLLVD